MTFEKVSFAFIQKIWSSFTDFYFTRSSFANLFLGINQVGALLNFHRGNFFEHKVELLCLASKQERKVPL